MAIPWEVAGQDPYLALLSRAYLEQQGATIRILGDHRGPLAIQRLMEDTIARASRCSELVLLLSPPQQQLACRKGCHFCCWSTVGVLAPEALYLAEELRGALPPAELAALSGKATRLAARLQWLDRGARLEARLPCPILRNGACSDYSHRPLACRWATSPSLQACLDLLVYRTKIAVEMEDVRFQPTQEVWRGLREGLAVQGLDNAPVALSATLAIALTDPHAADRYLRGEPVFAPARLAGEAAGPERGGG